MKKIMVLAAIAVLAVSSVVWAGQSNEDCPGACTSCCNETCCASCQ